MGRNKNPRYQGRGGGRNGRGGQSNQGKGSSNSKSKSNSTTDSKQLKFAPHLGGRTGQYATYASIKEAFMDEM